MENRYECSPQEAAILSTEKLRDQFLISNLFEPEQIKLTYTHYDRVIVGGALPKRDTCSTQS